MTRFIITFLTIILFAGQSFAVTRCENAAGDVAYVNTVMCPSTHPNRVGDVEADGQRIVRPALPAVEPITSAAELIAITELADNSGSRCKIDLQIYDGDETGHCARFARLIPRLAATDNIAPLIANMSEWDAAMTTQRAKNVTAHIEYITARSGE